MGVSMIDDWSPDPTETLRLMNEWYADPDVSCSLPDLRYTFYLALGAAVVVAALGMWILRHGQING